MDSLCNFSICVALESMSTYKLNIM